MDEQRLTLGSKIIEPADPYRFRTRAVRRKSMVTLVCGYDKQSLTSMQKCKSKPRARDPTTGQHHRWCSDCQSFVARFAAPRTSQTGVIVGRGPKPSAGTEMNANTGSNPAPFFCDVSVDVPIPVAKSLNGLSTQALQEKPEVQ